MKNSLIAMLGLIFIFCFGHNSVNAMEDMPTNIEDDNSETVFTPEKDWAIEEEFTEGISPFLSFTLNHSALGVNKYIKSNNAFNIKKGQKIKIKGVTWSPSGQKVQLGFINASNGNQYWTGTYSGGNKSGGTFSLDGPSGRYYVAIRTPSTNNKNINVKGQFEF